MAWIIPAISAITGLISQGNAAKQAQADASSQAAANTLAATDLKSGADAAMQQYASLVKLAQQIMANPMGGPLGPIINAIMNNYRNAGQSQISSAMNQLGPGMANPSGSLQDMMNALLTGGANYASQAMGTAEQAGLGMYQGAREGYANVAENLGRGLAGIWGPGGASSQYQQAGEQIAQNLAQQGSPFAPLMSWFQSPEGSAAASHFLTHMFPGSSAAASNAAGLSGFTPTLPLASGLPLGSGLSVPGLAPDPALTPPPAANLYVPGGGIGG